MRSKKKIFIVSLCIIISIVFISAILCVFVPFNYGTRQTKHSSFRLHIMTTSSLAESLLRNAKEDVESLEVSYAPSTQDEAVQIWIDQSDIMKEFISRKNAGQTLYKIYQKEEPITEESEYNIQYQNDSIRLDMLEILLASTTIQAQLSSEERENLEQLALEKLEEKQKYPEVYPRAVNGYSFYFGFFEKAPGYE